MEDHGTAGTLVSPGGGPYIWLDQVGAGVTPALDVYFDVRDPGSFTAQPPVEVVEPFTATHWGTRLMTVRDPDGRSVRLEAR